VFDDVDASLKALLADADAPAELRAADVVFDTPGRDFAPAQTTIDLFLHDVQENRTLRDPAPVLERNGDVIVGRRAPLRVDCTYLTTVWSTKSGGLKAADEHRLLGLALLWLGRFAEIEDRHLQGTLKLPPQPAPPPLTVAQTREGQPMGEFWTALGIAPRPAFSLTVTVALRPFTDTERFDAVKDVQVVGVIKPESAPTS
jgi:hypothetical protein